jgi:hypothetical protein
MIISAFSPSVSAAQALSIKKVVSVVFDDSGSMNDASKKWVYANYAMQTFAGLLNSQDELYITWMSEYWEAKKFDMSKDVQGSIDNIRSHFQGGGTPKESIDTATNQLKVSGDTNPNTQYWLVVITDGAIYPINNQNANLSESDLSNLFTSFTSEKMPNGSNPQVSYFSIGSSAVKVKEDAKKSLYTYSASNSDEIMDVMSQIADKVSGRIRVPADKMTFVDDKTVKFTSDLPMLNIAVLAQKTSAKVESAVGADANLTLVQSAKLLYPKAQSQLPTDESLKGGTFLFTNGAFNTPAGTYTFTFTEPINKDSVVIMYEPAIEIRMKVYLKGTNQEVTNIKDLFAGDEVDVVCKIYESGTDKEVDPSLLSDSVTYNVSYLEGGAIKQEVTDSSLRISGIKLNDTDSELKAAIEIPGFIPMVTSFSFHPQPPVRYTMMVDTPKGNTLIRTDLHKNEKGFVFTIFGDGIQLAKAEAENLNVHFTMKDPFGNKLDLEQTLNADGTYTCIPKYDGGWFPWRFWVSWPGIGLPVGELEVSGGIGEGTFKDLVTGTMTVESEPWWITLINIVLPILIALFILGLLFRRRFRRGLKVKSIDVTDNGYSLMSSGPNWSTKKLRAFNIWSLVPWIPSRIKIRGVMFYARPGGYVGVKPKNIGAKSSKLDGLMVEDNTVVDYPTSQMNEPFVPDNPEDMRTADFEDFDTGDVLFNTSNAQNGRLFKFIGGK